MSSTDVKEQADRAKEVLESPAFQQAFDDCLEGLNSTLADMPFDDTNGRLGISYQITGMAMVKQALVQRLEDWRLIEDENKRQQRAKLDQLAGESNA